MTINYYDSNSLHYFSSTKDIDMSGIYAEFVQLLPPSAYILDVGSGSGRDSKYFLEQGFRVFAIDGSAQLARLASDYISQTVHHMSFDEIDFEEQFDGIWACASLLHVPRQYMTTVFNKLQHALKPHGVWYGSYKWGIQDREVEGRLFTDYDDLTFLELVGQFSQLELVKWWRTRDSRNRDNDWLNVIIRKSERPSD